jgi:membrane fusion protein (multidrug efflux system)
MRLSRSPALFLAALLAAAPLATSPARAQMGPGGPPAVGVVTVKRTAMTETSEFVGRVQAIDRVQLSARVSAFLEDRLFTEGSEVKKGDLLFRLERGPFEASVQQAAAAVAQTKALLDNANRTLARAQSLINTPAGQRSTLDDAQAQQLSQAAQLMSAQAQLRAAQINLDYTEIHAPVSGKISAATFSVGNVVGPNSGPLATIVSQDPMYVVFNIAVRTALDLRTRYAAQGGLSAALVKLRLPDGRMYNETGHINYVAPTVATNTDTIEMRASIPNPPRADSKPDAPPNRELTDGEFVTVVLQGVEPLKVLAIPRTAVLTDQAGDYVYVVNAQSKVEQRRIQLGQSTPTTATVLNGLTEGEQVIVDGVQRVRPGIEVKAGPATPPATSGAGGTAPASGKAN